MQSNFTVPVVLSRAQRLVKSVPNGHLYEVILPNAYPGYANASQMVFVTHLYGNGSTWGVAQGQLLAPVINDFLDSVWAYFEEQIDEVLKDLPPWLATEIANVGLDAALDATELITRDYTDPEIYAELRGLAAGSGCDYQRLVRLHMVAGLTQGACSMVGLWGKALAPGTSLLQLRALDWNMAEPFRRYAAITVYHPTPGMGSAHALVGFPGFVGALSGMSSEQVRAVCVWLLFAQILLTHVQLAISEIGVSYPDPTFGKMSRVGLPFIFLLRSILRYDQTIDDAISRMAMAHRTCDLILGVGDGKLGEVRGVQYSYSVLHVIDDHNFLPQNSTWHAPIPDTVYFGMDWICPTYNTVLGGQIRKYYGQVTPQVARQNISAVEMSGDNHLVWYDLANSRFWAAFAAPPGVGGPTEAYWRQYVQVDGSVFTEPPK